MKIKTVLLIALIAFLTVISAPTINEVKPVKASNGLSYIYIRANGTIDPPGAPISTGDYVTYFLIEDVFNTSIIVERDNIIFNGRGCKLSGPTVGETGIENSIGINVTGIYNVTIKDTVIEKFDMGIYVLYSRNITLTGNNASNNKMFVLIDIDLYYWTGTGISVSRSNETILFNNTVSSNIWGINLYECNNTNVIGNNASNNRQYESLDSEWYGTGIYVSNSRNNTIVDNIVSDNGANGITVGSSTMDYPCRSNIISNNTISGHDYGAYSYGLYVSWSRNNTIAENTIFSNTYGVHVRYYSQDQTIMNNNISLNTCGIYFDSSTNNTIINNTLFKNACGIDFDKTSRYNEIISNNILNSSLIGVYIRTASNNNLVVGNNVVNNAVGIRFTESNNSTVFENVISSNTNDGLVIYYYSSNNEVANNNITLNNRGITITYGCYNNKFFHNNFIDNVEHVFTDVNSTWDNGYPSGGNYWSNYTGVDFNWGSFQNETGSDGIGDTKHTINENNTDGYPLMAPINTFEAGIWDTESRYVEVISNSTVSNFKINIAEKAISFNITGEAGFGFCRVIIPNTIVNTLWLDNYTVLVNGLAVQFRNWTDAETTYIYFSYPHSEHEVTIISEFPHSQILSLLILTITIAVALTKKRRQIYLNSWLSA